ncbi:histidine kinase [Actinoplanes sp. NPDC049596]|uniref:sensor histidine kinase n=1 Tax=unclassified Actinoplanes TaxID=2626549 RepID=UPI003446958D
MKWWHTAAGDVVLAVVVAAATVPQIYYHATHADPQLPAYVLFSALLVIPLAWRGRSPLPVFGLAVVVALAQWLTGIHLTADLALLIYLFTVASRCPIRVAAVAAGVIEVGALMAAVRWPETGSWAGTETWTGTFLLISGPVIAVLLLGVNARQRNDALRAAVQQAAAAERARIAWEMHDIIAHSLSVMVTLSEGAARKQATEPQRAAEAMRQVATTGRQALTETRRLLGVLRAPADRHPQPGLAQLDDLLDQVRATGLTVASEVTGAPADLSPGAELTVYRIVQEALTNTLKHATGVGRVSVAITHDPGTVTIEVHDDGTPPAGRPHGGHGLDGMRERAAVYAGTVSAGPGPHGGWHVHAELARPAGSAR